MREGERENERERGNVVYVEIKLSASACETTCDLICYRLA